MPTVSIETATLVARIAFLIGAVTDGLAVLPMLSPRIAAALFGGDPSRGTGEYRFAMRIGASLMAGWTILLIWGAACPIARRDLLLLTVFPVVIGIIAATIAAVRSGVLRRSRVIPLWIHLSFVCLLYLTAYLLTAPHAG